MRRALLLMPMLVLSPGLAAAQPYNYLPFKMPNTSANPFPWYLDARSANPAGLTLSGVQTAAQSAWQKWDDVSCAATAASFKGLTSSASIPDPRDPYDVYNVTAVWVTSNADPYYLGVLHNADVTAIALPLSYAGVLEQCDVYLNGVDRAWSTLSTTPVGAADLESILLHEVGHCLGLDHSYETDTDVMYASVPLGVHRRVLQTLDTGALCARYPVAGATGAPCLTDGGCGSNPGLKCVRPPQVDGGLGLPVCTVGCPTGQGFQCDIPYVCRSSSLFSPSYNGACLPPLNTVTLVGHPCSQNEHCGSSTGRCFTEGTLPSLFPWWQAGYCTQDCSPGQPSCPAGSACIDFGTGQGRWCLKDCRVGLGDCRPGYTCVLPPAGSAGICVSSCHSDADCNPDQCRVCDGTCLAKQNPSGQVGDVCSTADTCGVGQVCAKFDNSSVGICSQPCAQSCNSCPVGSTCHPVGSRGELYCLKDCQPHTCPMGLQCGQLATGRGCMPPCQSDLDCAFPNQCVMGECSNPYEGYDAGCALCPQPQDAGRPPVITNPDAGLPGPGTGGCGCAGGPGALAAFGVLVLLGLQRRRGVR